MEERRRIKPTWTHTRKVWWSYTWRCVVTTLIIMIPIAILLGFLGSMFDLPRNLTSAIDSFLSFVVALFAGFYNIRKLLMFRFDDFAVVLLEGDGEYFIH
jgi:hypothetical protein